MHDSTTDRLIGWFAPPKRPRDWLSARQALGGEEYEDIHVGQQTPDDQEDAHKEVMHEDVLSHVADLLAF